MRREEERKGVMQEEPEKDGNREGEMSIIGEAVGFAQYCAPSALPGGFCLYSATCWVAG